MQPLRTKKITEPLGTKKKHGTSWDKKKSLNLLGQKKSRKPDQTRPDQTKWIQMGPHGSKLVQMGPNWSKLIQIIQNGWKWVKIGPNGSK